MPDSVRSRCSTEFLALCGLEEATVQLLSAPSLLLTDGARSRCSLLDICAFLRLFGAKLNCPAIKQTIGIQNFDATRMFDTSGAFPPLDEQRGIAVFLDRETERIDALVAKKRQLIERLQEYRTALITRTVDPRASRPTPPAAAGLDPSHRPQALGRRVARRCPGALGGEAAVQCHSVPRRQTDPLNSEEAR